MEDELFGKVAEEKEARVFVGSYKEGKRTRALDTYEALAQHTTFAVQFGAVLQLVRHPPHSPTPRERSPVCVGVDVHAAALAQAVAGPTDKLASLCGEHICDRKLNASVVPGTIGSALYI